MKHQGERLLDSKQKGPSIKHSTQRKSPEMSALNKAVIPAILVLLCIGVRCSAMVAGVRYHQGKRILPGVQPVS